MSYILDALKKSEEKRGARATVLTQPSVISPSPVGQRRFVWPLIFAIAALLLGWFIAQWQASNAKAELDRSDETQAAQLQSPQTQPVQPQVIQTQPGKVQLGRLQSAKVQVDQIQTDQTQAIALASHPVAKVVTHTSARLNHVQEKKPIFKPVTPSSPVSRMDGSYRFVADSQVEPVKNIKSRFELPEAEQQSLPALNIEGHIYDAEPQARMVIINGKVRKEKQSISAGLLLQEITVDGVILNYHGHVFHMGVFDQ